MPEAAQELRAGSRRRDQLVQFIDPALAMFDPVQCMLEMSGMLDFGMPNGRLIGSIGIIDLCADPMAAGVGPVRVEVRRCRSDRKRAGQGPASDMVGPVLALTGGVAKADGLIENSACG